MINESLVPKGFDNVIWIKGKTFLSSMVTAKIKTDNFRYIDIDAINNKRCVVNEPKIIETKNAPSRAKRKLVNGCTLFSMVRPYLKNIAYIDKNLEDCIASTGFYVFNPLGFVDGEYLYYLLTSDFIVNSLNFYMKGDNSPSINTDNIEDFYFPIPSLTYQRKVVNYLKRIISIIEFIWQEKNILSDSINKVKIKILDYYFGENSCYKSYYTINKPLIDFAESITKGSTPTTYGYKFLDKGIKFIKVENVKNYSIDHSTINCFISDECHEFQKRSQLKVDDILISIAGTIGRIGVVKEIDIPANTNQAFAIISGYAKFIIPEYLKLYLVWYVNNKSNTLGHGGGMLNLTLTEIKNIIIKLPQELKIQQKIVNEINGTLSILETMKF